MKKRLLYALVIVLLAGSIVTYKVTKRPPVYWGISIRFEDTSTEEVELSLLHQYDADIITDGRPHDYRLVFQYRNVKRLSPILNELVENELIRDASIVWVAKSAITPEAKR